VIERAGTYLKVKLLCSDRRGVRLGTELTPVAMNINKDGRHLSFMGEEFEPATNNLVAFTFRLKLVGWG
jgi:hypothetical protein